MMILFLNVNSSMIELYGEEGIVRIPFRDAGEIYNHVEEKNILYITNAVKTGPKEVINMIRGMGIAVQEQNIPVDTGMKYLYSPEKGTIYINEFLKFEGEFDIKLIDEPMKQIIESNMLLQQLIKNKKIYIVGEIKRRKLMKNYKSHQEVMLEKQKKIDDSLDSIIVSTSVESALENGIVDHEHESAQEINILSGGSAADSGGMKTMSELMNEIEG
jgi:hypothetical protein